MNGDERRVYVDSEEELKYMNIEEFIRRVCPDDERESNTSPLCDSETTSLQGSHSSWKTTEPGCGGGKKLGRRKF